MQRISINDTTLNVETTGSGEPLLLVHGSWSDHQVWDDVVPALATRFRVVRYDRRGHGASDGPAATRRQQEDDLAALIEHIADGPVKLLGTSFGGSIVLGLGARRPDLVEALSVHEPPLISLAPDDEATTRELMAVGNTIGEVVERVARADRAGAAELFAEMVLGPGAWALLPPARSATMIASAESFVAEQQDPDWASIDVAGLSALTAPVQLTDGDQSPAWFRIIVATLAAAIEGSTIDTFAGAGHAPHLTHPAQHAAATMRFLARVPTAAR